MKTSDLKHSWNLSLLQAKELQEVLAEEISTNEKISPENISYLAGADVSVSITNQKCFSSVVILSFPELEIVESKQAEMSLSFPYVPGLLSFREGPVLLKAFKKLSSLPELIIFDGQGIAHPRRFGLACHLGWWLDIPSVGVAKTRLTGSHNCVGTNQGSWQFLTDNHDKIGAVVRTRTGVKPVYVSPGYKIDIQSSIKIVLACSPRFRIPEPTRQAHRLGQLYKDRRLKT